MKKLPWIMVGVLITAIPTVLAAYVTLFTDVSNDSWYGPAVRHLALMEVVEGYEDGTYKPNQNINRAEMAVMLDRFSDVIRNGCIYEDKFYLDGDSIYREELQEAECEKGNVAVLEIDPL